jgi:RNA polymerase sigma-70 factor (ECF subfamily)
LTKKNKLRFIKNEQNLKETFEKIYEGNFERLIRYAFSMTKEKGLAEDVVCNVFANLWNKRDQLKDVREIELYLNASVRNQAIKTIKSKAKLSLSKNKNEFTDDFTLSDNIDPENLLMGKELEKIVSQVVANLPPQARKVYNLSRLEKSNEEIAREMGISKRTVENHLYKALKILKESLEQYFKAKI